MYNNHAFSNIKNKYREIAWKCLEQDTILSSAHISTTINLSLDIILAATLFLVHNRSYHKISVFHEK